MASLSQALHLTLAHYTAQHEADQQHQRQRLAHVHTLIAQRKTQLLASQPAGELSAAPSVTSPDAEAPTLTTSPVALADAPTEALGLSPSAFTPLLDPELGRLSLVTSMAAFISTGEAGPALVAARNKNRALVASGLGTALQKLGWCTVHKKQEGALGTAGSGGVDNGLLDRAAALAGYLNLLQMWSLSHSGDSGAASAPASASAGSSQQHMWLLQLLAQPLIKALRLWAAARSARLDTQLQEALASMQEKQLSLAAVAGPLLAFSAELQQQVQTVLRTYLATAAPGTAPEGGGGGGRGGDGVLSLEEGGQSDQLLPLILHRSLLESEQLLQEARSAVLDVSAAADSSERLTLDTSSAASIITPSNALSLLLEHVFREAAKLLLQELEKVAAALAPAPAAASAVGSSVIPFLLSEVCSSFMRMGTHSHSTAPAAMEGAAQGAASAAGPTWQHWMHRLQQSALRKGSSALSCLVDTLQPASQPALFHSLSLLPSSAFPATLHTSQAVAAVAQADVRSLLSAYHPWQSLLSAALDLPSAGKASESATSFFSSSSLPALLQRVSKRAGHLLSAGLRLEAQSQYLTAAHASLLRTLFPSCLLIPVGILLLEVMEQLGQSRLDSHVTDTVSTALQHICSRFASAAAEPTATKLGSSWPASAGAAIAGLPAEGKLGDSISRLQSAINSMCAHAAVVAAEGSSSRAQAATSSSSTRTSSVPASPLPPLLNIARKLATLLQLSQQCLSAYVAALPAALLLLPVSGFSLMRELAAGAQRELDRQSGLISSLLSELLSLHLHQTLSRVLLWRGEEEETLQGIGGFSWTIVQRSIWWQEVAALKEQVQEALRPLLCGKDKADGHSAFPSGAPLHKQICQASLQQLSLSLCFKLAWEARWLWLCLRMTAEYATDTLLPALQEQEEGAERGGVAAAGAATAAALRDSRVYGATSASAVIAGGYASPTGSLEQALRKQLCRSLQAMRGGGTGSSKSSSSGSASIATAASECSQLLSDMQAGLQTILSSADGKAATTAHTSEAGEGGHQGMALVQLLTAALQLPQAEAAQLCDSCLLPLLLAAFPSLTDTLLQEHAREAGLLSSSRAVFPAQDCLLWTTLQSLPALPKPEQLQLLKGRSSGGAAGASSSSFSSSSSAGARSAVDGGPSDPTLLHVWRDALLEGRISWEQLQALISLQAVLPKLLLHSATPAEARHVEAVSEALGVGERYGVLQSSSGVSKKIEQSQQQLLQQPVLLVMLALFAAAGAQS